MESLCCLLRVLPVDSLLVIWRCLPQNSKAAFRLSCKAIRDIIDSTLVDRLLLDLSRASTQTLDHAIRMVQRTCKLARLDLNMSAALKNASPINFNGFLLRLVVHGEILGSLESLTLDCSWKGTLDLDHSLLALFPTRLPKLAALSLHACSISLPALNSLSSCTALRSLHLDMTLHVLSPADPGDAFLLLELPLNLTALDLVLLRCADPSWRLDLAHLQPLTNLQSLALKLHKCTNPAALQSLTRLTRLRVYDLDTHNYRFLLALPQLVELYFDMYHSRVPLELLLGLSQFSKLSSLAMDIGRDLPTLTWQFDTSTTIPALCSFRINRAMPLQTLHWLLRAAGELEALWVQGSGKWLTVEVPSPGAVAGGQEALVEMLREVVQRLGRFPGGWKARLDLDFTRFRQQGDSSVAPYIEALAPLQDGLSRSGLSLVYAGVDAAVLAAVASALPWLRSLQLNQCRVLDPASCLPLLAHHAGLKQGMVVMDDCCWLADDASARDAVMALGGLAPGMEIRVREAVWWGAEEREELTVVQQQQQRKKMEQQEGGM